MKPRELEDFLVKMDLTNEDFATLVDMSTAAVLTWLKGTRSIPPTVAKLVRFFDKYPKTMSQF